jgi:hypothetical protein
VTTYYALFFGAPHFIRRSLIYTWVVITLVVLALLRGAPERTSSTWMRNSLFAGATTFVLATAI